MINLIAWMEARLQLTRIFPMIELTRESTGDTGAEECGAAGRYWPQMAPLHNMSLILRLYLAATGH